MLDNCKTIGCKMIFALAKMSERRIIAGILALGLLARIIAAYWLPDQSAFLIDSIDYRESAHQLLAHGRIANPYQMPLYPLFIAAVGKWQIVADIIVSVVTIWLIYKLASELMADRLTAILAALATACYPPLIFFSVIGLSETLFIALMLAAFLFWYRGNFTAASFFAALAILTRPIFDVAPLILIYFALVVHRLSFVQTFKRLAVYAAIYCGLLTPWWIHNYLSYDRFVRLTAGSGYQLYAGNNPLNTSGGAIKGVDYNVDTFASIPNDADRDRAMGKAAMAFIASHPARFIELAGLKFIRMWRPWPTNVAYASTRNIVISVLTFVPVLLLSGLGLFFARHNMRRLSPVILFGLGYTAINMIMAGTIRYRLPLEPFLLILASFAASQIWANSVSWRSEPTLAHRNPEIGNREEKSDGG
jgi:4-amino-4-deoxy-L-arabinose transferase-like glycosyltransferase